MEATGIFGAVFGTVAFMMAGFALWDVSQLRKDIADLRSRLPDVPAANPPPAA